MTNSSSSSFVCDICGNVESGWDLCLSDADMYECVNGHTFCCNEALKVSKEELIKLIMKEGWNNKWNRQIDDYEDVSEKELNEMELDEVLEFTTDGGNYDAPECLCPICNFIEYSESDLSKYLLKEYGVPRDEVFEEVKKFNKRRKKLYDNEYITYVCKKFDLNPAEIVASWKDKFGTYAKFSDYLRDK